MLRPPLSWLNVHCILFASNAVQFGEGRKKKVSVEKMKAQFRDKTYDWHAKKETMA